MNKQIKPNLVDPMLQKKIFKTLNPPVEDYWAPTKNSFQNFYKNFIRPNIFLIIFIIILALLLYYRYRVVKTEREERELQKIYNGNNNNGKDNKNIEVDDLVEKYQDVLLYLYNQQKENMREPKIKKQNLPEKFAYPVYPYKGSLSPTNSR
ncbi:membrane protein [Moumouvirus goulette]|uniref:Membrane protein n=1 Tax=Moumouvirus goulette TaxID=1247379 RepID=M1PGS0_9VIRU|nr:membrane protein [Moumouvirus goulette]AGF85213.1 membrane protein [Moumouvirus goulette]